MWSRPTASTNVTSGFDDQVSDPCGAPTVPHSSSVRSTATYDETVSLHGRRPELEKASAAGQESHGRLMRHRAA